MYFHIFISYEHKHAHRQGSICSSVGQGYIDMMLVGHAVFHGEFRYDIYIYIWTVSQQDKLIYETLHSFASTSIM